MPHHAAQPRWSFTPREAFACWPSERPLAALLTCAHHEQWGRVSVLAEPAEPHTIPWVAHGAAACNDALRQLEATLRSHAWFEARTDHAGCTAATPDTARTAHTAHAAGSRDTPATPAGMWVVSLAYEWGGLVEPLAMPRHRPPPDGWPLAVLAWCPAPLLYLHDEERWVAPPAAHALGDLLQARSDRAQTHAAQSLAPGTPPQSTAHADPAAATITDFASDTTRADFESAVARTIEFIRAGDIFQANIAQRHSARWAGNPRAIACAAFEAGLPRYGAYLETPTHALASMSPELFLHAAADGAVVSRPIKGTRAYHEDPASLLASEKDAAELHMIVDLMRNDLGRLCDAGSVRVAEARALEAHATVHHAVADVRGRLRAGTTLTDVLRAAWPPGSVTGAPKVRALQVIDELEPVARGPYCGAIGALSNDDLTLNVCIRTICMHRDAPGAAHGTLRYSAGCGIVADSAPTSEFEESLHKTAVMLRVAHALRRRQGGHSA